MLLNVIWHFFSKVSSHWALGKILSVLKNTNNNGLGKTCIHEVRWLTSTCSSVAALKKVT